MQMLEQPLLCAGDHGALQERCSLALELSQSFWQLAESREGSCLDRRQLAARLLARAAGRPTTLLEPRLLCALHTAY